MGNNLLQGATLVPSKRAWVDALETERYRILTILHSMLRSYKQSEFGHRLRMFDFTHGMALVFLYRKLGNWKKKTSSNLPRKTSYCVPTNWLVQVLSSNLLLFAFHSVQGVISAFSQVRSFLGLLFLGMAKHKVKGITGEARDAPCKVARIAQSLLPEQPCALLTQLLSSHQPHAIRGFKAYELFKKIARGTINNWSPPPNFLFLRSARRLGTNSTN